MGHQRGDVDLAEAAPPVERDESDQVRPELLPVDLSLHHRKLEQRLGQFVDVMAGQGSQDRRQVMPKPVVHLPHHAEVDQTDAAVRLDEQVARVRIGVEEPVFEDHAHGHPGRLGGQGRPVDPSSVERGQVVDLGPGDPFQRQDASRRGRPEHPGDVHVRIGREVGGEAFGVPALGEVVEFAAQRHGEVRHQTWQVVVLGGLPAAADAVRQILQDREISLDHLVDLRPADLDHDLGAVVQGGEMGLPDGRAGQRLGVEAGKDLSGGAPSSCSTRSLMAAAGTGGAESCSLDSSRR